MRSDTVILAFDTSAAHCAAALLRAGAITAVAVEEMGKGQAERLMPLLEEMLAAQGLHWRDLDAIAVGVGPGNFTGVRIAVSAARGLALALKIPAIGVSTLDALAEGAPRPVTVVMDARRDEVYAQDFTAEGAGAPHLLPRADLDASGPTREGITGAELIEAIAQIAARRLATGETVPRPAPLYLRGADAAPPSDPPPVILD
ncbi:MAG: tRNA (adenosine(37)-N6)-threonylcarbamoyltransferase complex dimerization subunit type 1 TsaB [Paenirhodobacter sp.]|uniref:tRNA (adenosine(37)-N6)-threonylcarbamoyltransferase complex dimerization subunit type 1 TsaB n=1 Tax=Paenirhodobacter sp. TaxID=1965326 RepID=UPI003D0A4D20